MQKGGSSLTELAGYLKERIAVVRFARFVGEVVSAFGSCISIVGLFLRILFLTISGFSFLIIGLYVSVHFELQRLDYAQALDRITRED